MGEQLQSNHTPIAEMEKPDQTNIYNTEDRIERTQMRDRKTKLFILY